ncbi:MAG: replicative DNA helicase [Anaerofustis sp.]
MSSIFSKTPPYSEEAEKSVLGCMMLDKNAVIAALDILSEDDFYIDQNKWIFSAVAQLGRDGYAVDPVTILDRLKKDGVIDKIGAAYLAELTEIVPSARNVEQYCRIVSEKATLREMIAAFGDLISKCYENQEPLAQIIEEAEQFIYELSVNKTRTEFTALKDAMKPALLKLGDLYQQNTSMTGVPTGYKDLDFITSGFQPSDMILIAARPSMGKTALGLNIAQNASFRGKKTVAFFSLEMSCEQLIMRIISGETEVNSKKIKLGNQSDMEWRRITLLNSSVQESNVSLYIDDTSGISVGEARSKLRKLKATHGLDMVVIDYLQLMTTNLRMENRQQEISAISRELKSLAKELNCPVVALSQLSRSPESRGDKRPILSDLRESGAIEQDADVVILLYRDSYYNKEAVDDLTELIIAKHRNGEVGTVKLSFLKEYTKFVNADPVIVQEQPQS